MDVSSNNFSENGLAVFDLAGDTAFAARRLHQRDDATQMEGMYRLAVAFVERPETILQELVNVAVELCGADSAGISVQRDDAAATEENFYSWVATAGVYSPFLYASLPHYPSACTVCLERGRPQHFRASKRFFDLIGVDAALVMDGLILPWEVEGMSGTIFIISHNATEAFDPEDLRLMQILAKFAAIGVRQHRQHETLLKQSSAGAVAAMANDLAHRINNPLQGLMNQLYLAEHHPADVGDERSLALKLMGDFGRLTALVEELLRLYGRSEVERIHGIGTETASYAPGTPDVVSGLTLLKH